MKKANACVFKKIDFFFLSFIILIALLFRLYKVSIPLADFHSWRQVDTAAVARNFVKSGFDLLHPRYDDISASSTGKENPQGYRLVEFPLYNAIFAYLYKIMPFLPLEIWGRLTSIFFSLITIGVIYYLSLKEAGRSAAIAASLTYAVFPFFVFFSRTILPETTSNSFALVSIFFLYLFTHHDDVGKNFLFFFLSLISFALSLLIKPTAIFYGIVLLSLFLQKYKLSIFKRFSVLFYFLLAVLPLFLWREHIKLYPEGIPPSEWLITSVNTYLGLKSIFFKPAFFRWIFFERINNLILGGYLTFLFLLGVLTKPKSFLFHSFLISSLTYLFAFQGGNVQHEYYQIFILPTIAVFIGLGIFFVTKNTKAMISPFLVYPAIAIIFVLSFFFSYYKVRDYYNYPAELPQIAKIITALTKEDDKIVTERMGDTTLLYLADRKGAPSIYQAITEYQKAGYRYLVTTTKETIENLKNEGVYTIVFENDKFAMFKL